MSAPFTIEKILCPTDFSVFSARAFRHAVSLARQYGAGLKVAHVIPRMSPYPGPALYPAPIAVDPETRALAEADMNGSLVQSTQVATDAIPWDREFPGTRHYAVGYLSYRLPTIMDVPDQTQVFINSLEPRWFFGSKGFAETALASARDGGWLTRDALIVVEEAAGAAFAAPDGFAEIERRDYGDTQATILRLR